ncbi:MAG: hypothetical protein WBA74_18315 [Cyclobacteriaceae bacterium]
MNEQLAFIRDEIRQWQGVSEYLTTEFGERHIGCLTGDLKRRLSYYMEIEESLKALKILTS